MVEHKAALPVSAADEDLRPRDGEGTKSSAGGWEVKRPRAVPRHLLVRGGRATGFRVPGRRLGQVRGELFGPDRA